MPDVRDQEKPALHRDALGNGLRTPDSPFVLNDITGIRLSTPLRYLENRAAYVLWEPDDTAAIASLLGAAPLGPATKAGARP